MSRKGPLAARVALRAWSLATAPTRPLERWFFGTLTHVKTSEPAVALTFDDGPHPETTPRFLELLEKFGARGTFFAIGRRARAHPDLIERIVQGGHSLGNHTLDHKSLPHLSPTARRQQLDGGNDALGAHASKLLRPPFGHQTPASRIQAGRLGYEVVGWSHDCRDWQSQDSAELESLLEAALEPGAIVLLHDALFLAEEARYADRGPLLVALEAVLRRHERSHHFVTVPELLQLGKPKKRAWRSNTTGAYLSSLEEVT